jgi:colicin import membrane protein
MTATQGLKCTIQVKLLPSGDVMEAVVVSSSGDPVFDRSAENAVRKASPLPVPQDKGLFNQEFRIFTFVFKPE